MKNWNESGDRSNDQMVSMYLIKRIDALDERIARMESGQYYEMVNLIQAARDKASNAAAQVKKMAGSDRDNRLAVATSCALDSLEEIVHMLKNRE